MPETAAAKTAETAVLAIVAREPSPERDKFIREAAWKIQELHSLRLITTKNREELLGILLRPVDRFYRDEHMTHEGR